MLQFWLHRGTPTQTSVSWARPHLCLVNKGLESSLTPLHSITAQAQDCNSQMCKQYPHHNDSQSIGVLWSECEQLLFSINIGSVCYMRVVVVSGFQVAAPVQLTSCGIQRNSTGCVYQSCPAQWAVCAACLYVSSVHVHPIECNVLTVSLFTHHCHCFVIEFTEHYYMYYCNIVLLMCNSVLSYNIT